MKKVILTAAILVLLPGCTTVQNMFSGVGYHSRGGLAVVSNTKRNFVVDYSQGEKGDKVRRCLEAPGPAALLDDFKLEVVASGSGGDITDGELELDVKNTESLAKLYEVSSILQYTHAMSYRLCEASLNGSISNAEFSSRFDKLADTTTSLLRIQLEISREKTRQAELQLEEVKLKLK